ncbi:EVE domain-containing protein [Pseudohongiella sp.]|uniref:EVE domain-containing protein n=1 Tax=marine sediment metagenome TaxID=412755 RepID=A0A0F9W5L7_9ZZZZ|nr:EVE domain-containing protein [Pseudohongiella sp.]HDZ07711.1 EVE domain-containing protein [Pseudohongiella sp.]HEA63291.1 EVE domain-containing protein [Pseudohongiella sp.]
MAKWLAKTEPDECSIDDFAGRIDKAVVWEGVRNYQARNFLRDMAVGDEVFIYHSSCRHIGIAGIVKVVRAAYPDPSQFDEKSPYLDAKSPVDKPRWQAVDMVFVNKLPRLLPLDELKSLPGLQDLALVKKGSRLSVMPVSDAEWNLILSAV